MNTRSRSSVPSSTASPSGFWLGAALFAAIALFLLLSEHRAHLLVALPWLLVLACPLLHLFMHRGHQYGGGAHSDHRSDGEVSEHSTRKGDRS